MLADFYGAFAQVTLTALGLWLVVVQTRHADWAASDHHRRRASAVSLHFALPGLMSLLSLVDSDSKVLWRVSFTLSALAGAAGLLLLAPRRRRGSRAPGVAGLVQRASAVLYVVIALVALFPGSLRRLGIRLAPIQVEAVLLSLLVFLGLGLAWMLLFEPVDAGEG